jgi:hypothetical protein
MFRRFEKSTEVAGSGLVAIFVSTIGVNEDIIRQYVQKQDVKERQGKQLGFDW